MTELAIVIVSWNVKELLRNCLISVLADMAAGHVSTEVWVVDNASSDGSAEMVRHDFPSAYLIAGEQNLGFAGGNNAALRAIGFTDTPGARQSATTDLPQVVLLLNPDTEVHPGALKTLVEFFRGTPQAGIAGARLVFGDGSFQHSAFAFPGLWQLAIELLPVPGRLIESTLNGRYPRARYHHKEPFLIGHPLGAAMAVRREAIEQVGLLDEGYHMYVEEVDWSKRIVSAGWRAYCVPEATVTHFGGQSTGQIQTQMFTALWASRYRFYGKYYNNTMIWAARQIVRLGMQRKAKQEETAARQGQITPTQLSERLHCYQKVVGIWQEKTP